jgi:hypothetical protein
MCQGVSVETSNQYLTALRGFFNWMVSDTRLAENPVTHLEPGNVDVDRPQDRRELEAEELRLLLGAARDSQRSFRDLTGPDRYHLYATACGTGFRALVLSSLTPESFDLDGEDVFPRPDVRFGNPLGHEPGKNGGPVRQGLTGRGAGKRLLLDFFSRCAHCVYPKNKGEEKEKQGRSAPGVPGRSTIRRAFPQLQSPGMPRQPLQ